MENGRHVVRRYRSSSKDAHAVLHAARHVGHENTCLDRDIFPIYLLFSVFVLPDIWLMMEALLFVIAELDRFGFRTELVFTVKLTAGKMKTRKNVTI